MTRYSAVVGNYRQLVGVACLSANLDNCVTAQLAHGDKTSAKDAGILQDEVRLCAPHIFLRSLDEYAGFAAIA